MDTEEIHCEVCFTPLLRRGPGPPPRFCTVCLRRPPSRRRPLSQFDALADRQRSVGLEVPPPRSRLMRAGRRS